MPMLNPLALRPLLRAGALVLSLCLAGAAQARVAVIPSPASALPRAGAIWIRPGAAIAVPMGDKAALFDARWLAQGTRRDRGLRLQVRHGASSAAQIRLTRLTTDAGLGPEGYRLEVAPDGIQVAAATDAGLFYGVGTLFQLLTPGDAGRGAVRVEGVAIEDRPRYPWRGLMLDSARHFQSVRFIEALLDQMARYKLNTFHWHLTDDQAWRLAIPGFPRLTAVSGCDDAGRRTTPTGGCYTPDQVRRLVAYAAARGVTIVPEIEMPGHASAAILAYPALGVRPVDPKTFGDWGVFPNLYNVNEATFSFLEAVLAEVMRLFPGPYVHIGGDEAIKPYWRDSPDVQAKIRTLGLSDADALQGWFVKRIEAYLAAHKRRLVGWDEILQDGLPNGAVVMSWHGVGRGLAAIKAGRDAVLTPAAPLYLDFRQSDLPDEPPGRGQVNDLKAVYDFEPGTPAEGDPGAGRILGVQANLWTEHVRLEAWAERMAFPRAAALAEVAWSPPAARDWSNFVARLPAALRRDEAAGLRPARSAYAVRADLAYDPSGRRAEASLGSQASAGEIRYTVDGSRPSPTSDVYQKPLSLTLPVRLRARAFGPDASRLGPETDLKLDAGAAWTRENHALALCTNRLPLNIEEDPSGPSGVRATAMTDILNPCWMWRGARLAGRTGVRVDVGASRFNYAFGGTFELPAPPPPHVAAVELEVRLDSCAGPSLAVAALPADAERRRGATMSAPFIAAALPAGDGPHDLCFIFARRGFDPLWSLNRVTLDGAAAP